MLYDEMGPSMMSRSRGHLSSSSLIATRDRQPKASTIQNTPAEEDSSDSEHRQMPPEINEDPAAPASLARAMLVSTDWGGGKHSWGQMDSKQPGEGGGQRAGWGEEAWLMHSHTHLGIGGRSPIEQSVRSCRQATGNTSD